MSWNIVKNKMNEINHKDLEREVWGSIEEHEEPPFEGKIEVDGVAYNTFREAELAVGHSLFWHRKNRYKGVTNTYKIRENEK
jgi:hypothetical protein